MRIALLLFASCGVCAAQGWTDLGANTQLNGSGQNVCPPNNYNQGVTENGVTQESYSFSGQCHSVYAAWGSGLVDTKRNRWCTFGGGHTDYYGNELYCMNLTGTPALTRLTNPSIFDGTCCGETMPSEAMAGGAPSSGHAYEGWVYDPDDDKYISFGRGMPTGVSPYTWIFDPACSPSFGVRTCWTQKSGVGFGTVNDHSEDGVRCDWDTRNHRMLCELGTFLMLRQYVPSTDTWTTITAYQTLCVGASAGCTQSMAVDMVIDPVRAQVWFFGTSTNVLGQIANLVVLWVDLTGSDSYATHDVSSTVTGCSAMNVQYPGLYYDPARGVITGYPNLGNTMVTFNPTTGQCVNQTFTSGPPASPGGFATSNGVNHRFAFVPSIGKYVVLTAADVDAFELTLDHDASFNLNNSTLYCLDRDGDGYGTGPLQLGPFTDLVIAATNTDVSSASYSFVPAIDTGRHIAVTAGTGFTVGDYAITCIGANCAPVAAAGTARLDRSPGTAGSTGGSWNSPGCSGPDADDLDATVHTGAQAIAKWSTVTGWLNHLGYAPSRIWYLSPAVPVGSALAAGNDGTCVVNSTSPPCQTFSHIAGSLLAGDAVVVGNQFNDIFFPPSGSWGNPLIFAGYPGEVPRLCGAGCGASGQFSLVNISNIVIDGFGVNGGASIAGGTGDSNTNPTTQYRIIKHTFGEEDDGLGPIEAFNGLIDWVIEDNYLENANSQHNIYIGIRALAAPNFRVSLRRNIFHNAAYNCVHLNGRFQNLWVEGNLAWNCSIAGFSFQEGISNSYIFSNLIFNAGTSQVDVDDYPGSSGLPPFTGGNAPLMNCGPSFNATCTCPGVNGNVSANQNSICPYNQTGNLWENNTFYQTNMNPCNNRFCTSAVSNSNAAAFTTFNTSAAPVQLGSNTWRNNIFVNYGNNNGGPPLLYSDVNGAVCSGPAGTNTTCLGWAANSTYNNNTFFQNDGNAGNQMLFAGAGYTCAGSTAILGANTNCLTSNPQFVAASPSFWNTPTSFNFNLATGSASIHSGSATGVPVFDEIGKLFTAGGPSRGAREASSCNITPLTLGPWTNTQVISKVLTEANCNASNFALTGAWPTNVSGCSSGSGPTCTASGTINTTGTFTPCVSYDTAMNCYSVVVNPIPAVASCNGSPSTCPSVASGQPYSETVITTGGTTPNTCALTGGSLAGSGITLNANCTLTGTGAALGTYSLTVTPTDSNSISGTSLTFSLSVIATCSVPSSVGYDRATDGGWNSGNTASLSWTHNISSSSTPLLAVCLVGDGVLGNDDITSVTYASVPMTLAAKHTSTSPANNNNFTYLYLLPGAPTGSNTVSVIASHTHTLAAASVSYSGASVSGQPDNASDFPASSSSPYSTSLTTVKNNAWMILCEGGRPQTAGAGSTLRVIEGATGAAAILDSNGAITPAGSYSMATNSSVVTADDIHIMASISPYVPGNCANSVPASNFLTGAGIVR